MYDTQNHHIKTATTTTLKHHNKHIFGRSKTQVTVDGRTQDITNNITSLGIGPGYTIFSNNCFALETQVKYNYGISRNEVNLNGVSTSTKTFSNAWDFVVGATYYFSR